MSLIEKAAQRLDQLKQASAEPGDEPAQAVLPQTPLQPRAAESVAAEAKDFSKSSEVPLSLPQTQSAAMSRTVHIDLDMLATKGMVTPEQPRSAIAEEFRVIKRPLLRNATDAGPARIDNAKCGTERHSAAEDDFIPDALAQEVHRFTHDGSAGLIIARSPALAVEEVELHHIVAPVV